MPQMMTKLQGKKARIGRGISRWQPEQEGQKEILSIQQKTRNQQLLQSIPLYFNAYLYR